MNFFNMFNDILDDIPPWSVCCTKDVICHAYDTWKLLQSFSFYLRVPLSHARKLTFSHVICRTMGSCPFWIRKLSFYVSPKYLVKLININSPSKIVWSNFVSPGCGGRSKKWRCHLPCICHLHNLPPFWPPVPTSLLQLLIFHFSDKKLCKAFLILQFLLSSHCSRFCLYSEASSVIVCAQVKDDS